MTITTALALAFFITMAQAGYLRATGNPAAPL